jgi:hypothetical protein
MYNRYSDVHPTKFLNAPTETLLPEGWRYPSMDLGGGPVIFQLTDEQVPPWGVTSPEGVTHLPYVITCNRFRSGFYGKRR